MNRYTPKTKIGYLGGGQLAQMLTESAHQLGLEPHVLSLNNDNPAALNCRHHHLGSLEKVTDLESFLSSVDVTTFESEFLNASKLKEAQKNTKAKIYPSVDLMAKLQDRKSQKNIFDKNKLPTSPWMAVDSKQEIEAFLKINGLPVVFKKRFFGYDGYGTFVVKTKKQLSDFLKNEFKSDLFIVEKFIPFKKECAVIIARSRDGSFTNLPFVESFQKDSRCDWVKGPLRHQSSTKMLPKLKKFLKELDYVGCMGVEFFVTSKGLIINEIAPRVHNTGHYSQETEGPSQFDLHNMCLLGLKLPKIKIKGGFAMANLIGSEKKTSFEPTPGLHWYGKKENRKGRKMGHINCLGPSADLALNSALKMRKGIKL